MSCDLEQSVINELNMCLETPLPQKAGKTSSSPSEFIPNVIPSCWAGINYPIFTFDNDHIQISIVMIFNTDNSIVFNKYEEAKRVWEEYAELEQEESEIEKAQRKMMKNVETELKSNIELYKEQTKMESNGQLIEESERNKNRETNDEDTLKNEDSFNEDLDSSNDKTKTNDDSTDKSQMDDDI